MQAVGAIVDRQVIDLAVKRELALGDPVAIAADQRAKVGVGVEIAVEIVEAERHVVDLAVLVGNLDRLDRAAIGDDVHLHAVAVLEAIHLHRLAVGHGPERLHRYGKRSGVSGASERDNARRQCGKTDRGVKFVHMRPPWSGLTPGVAEKSMCATPEREKVAPLFARPKSSRRSLDSLAGRSLEERRLERRDVVRWNPVRGRAGEVSKSATTGAALRNSVQNS